MALRAGLRYGTGLAEFGERSEAVRFEVSLDALDDAADSLRSGAIDLGGDHDDIGPGDQRFEGVFRGANAAAGCERDLGIAHSRLHEAGDRGTDGIDGGQLPVGGPLQMVERDVPMRLMSKQHHARCAGRVDALHHVSHVREVPGRLHGHGNSDALANRLNNPADGGFDFLCRLLRIDDNRLQVQLNRIGAAGCDAPREVEPGARGIAAHARHDGHSRDPFYFLDAAQVLGGAAIIDLLTKILRREFGRRDAIKGPLPLSRQLFLEQGRKYHRPSAGSDHLPQLFGLQRERASADDYGGGEWKFQILAGDSRCHDLLASWLKVHSGLRRSPNVYLRRYEAHSKIRLAYGGDERRSPHSCQGSID